MRFFQQALSAIVFGLVSLAATAAPVAPVEGAEYRKLEKLQQTDSGKKIEVLEFFWYSCPHCFAFEPSLAEWVKKQGDNIVFKRVPVVFRESFQPQQKLFYALEIMGKVDEMHKKVFNAIHVERKRLDTDAAIVDFVASQGIDKNRFVEAYNSFAVQTKANRVIQLQQSYHVDGVPMVAIDGRYVTSPSIVSGSPNVRDKSETGLHTATLEVMDFLVAKAREQAGGAKTKPAKAAGGAAAGK
jgi:thiol:disulfide interchange protein DsbA